MTEADLQELTTIITATAMSSISIYLSILSAFLVVAYLVGSQLTRGQVFVISTLFLLGALFFTYATTGIFIRQSSLVERLAKIAPGEIYFVNEWVALTVGSIQLLGILACLKFMWDVRHPKAE